ncbi:MAG TPA: iron-sulfur cluster assembly accessory protein [Acidiferrobacter sp.]|nr:iron-sulfur cluster assembly accessory protein [Acidiferrobacter sp.]
MCITITPAALHFMRRIVRLSGRGQSGFRLQVSPGGCSGMSVDFSVEDGPLAEDVVMDYEGMKIFMPLATQTLLEKCTVDFADTLHSSGLTVKDPRSTACGCGETGVSKVDISALKRKV